MRKIGYELSFIFLSLSQQALRGLEYIKTLTLENYQIVTEVVKREVWNNGWRRNWVYSLRCRKGETSHRIIESSQLEKTLKIIKSNDQLVLLSPAAKPHPLVPCLHVSEITKARLTRQAGPWAGIAGWGRKQRARWAHFSPCPGVSESSMECCCANWKGSVCAWMADACITKRATAANAPAQLKPR